MTIFVISFLIVRIICAKNRMIYKYAVQINNFIATRQQYEKRDDFLSFR